MNFVKGAEVFTASGEKIGTISRIVIDAKKRDITDVVVERGALFKDEKVIPVGLVDLENEDRITLGETNQDIDDFLDYETTHYVPLDEATVPYGEIDTYYWYPPVSFQIPTRGVLPIRPDYVLQTETSIPEGRVAIAEGAQVISRDEKHIGNVEQVIANSETHNVTHFVVGKGFLLKEHKVVPAQWVTTVEEGKIYLSVEARLFDRLPDYQPQ
jgi:uncharacterized protein YrrD